MNGALARGRGLERFALLFARIALGAAFLSGIASRFGWWGKGVGYGNFTNFIHATGEVCSFMPASTIPFLAYAATAGEFTFGVALLAGFRLPWAAFGSAILLALFGVAMAISSGVKSPLDYSVFSASSCALLIAALTRRAPGDREGT